MKRTFLFLSLAAVALAPACSRNKANTARVETARVTRRDIVVAAEANGAVEPINVVEVKSKASGLITRMPVETGTNVKPGDLIVQVDQRDVRNQFEQADADLKASEANLDVASSQKKRSDEMFAQKVITAQEHETAALSYAQAQASVVRARTNLDLARQRLEDATVTAPITGTVIEKDVSQGMVITSATGAFGGGTTLIKMADLSKVRMRAQFNETDIGQIRSGQPATVTVDAYPDRRFTGLVEKIEPQAVVQQGVTMFPVLVTLTNLDGALKPGMNGEVSVQIDNRVAVLAVPNDAVKNVREAMATAPLLGLDPDSVQAQVRAQFGGMRGGMGGMGGSTSGGQGGGFRNGTRGGQQGGSTRTSGGEVALEPAQGVQDRQSGGFQMPEVSDKDCAAVKTAMDKKPGEVKKLDALRERVRSGELDRTAMREESQKIYAAIGVDPRIAGACRMREMRAQGGQSGALGVGGAGAPAGASTSANAARRQSGAARPQLQLGSETMGSGTRARPGLVFVAKGTTFEPRMVMLGAGNFDYTEVLSGLNEGEEVALLSALSLQAQRQQQNDRLRQNMGGGVPGMSQGGGGRPGGGGR